MRSSIVLVIAFACPTFAADAPQFKSLLPKIELKNGDCVVFLGDSITHQCLYTQYVEDYFYTRFPMLRIRFHNAGVGGAQAWDALQRFDKDVAAFKPRYVTVLLGMNDGRYQPFDKAIFSTYRKDMLEVIARIEASGATPILMSPTMFDSRAARSGKRKHDAARLEEYNSVLAYYGLWLQERAFRNGYGYVDLFSPLNAITRQARKKNANFTLIRDAVHPDPPGQLVMAYTLLRSLMPNRVVSAVQMSLSPDRKKVTTRVANGKATDVKYNRDGVSFTLNVKSLPWVVPAEAQSAAKLLKLGQNMGTEVLQIPLPSGRYDLTIDGESIGAFTNVQFFRGVQLQDNPKTPQYKQSLRVAELNKRRNDGPVKSLRNEWRKFQAMARLAAQAKREPKNEQLARRVAKLETELDGMDERIAKLQAAAKKIEDEIYKANQPKPRKYQIKRMVLADAPSRPSRAVAATKP